MENAAEDAIIKKWEEIDDLSRREKQAIAGASKKRKRIADKPAEPMPGIFELIESSDVEVNTDRGASARRAIASSDVSESGTVPVRKTRSKRGAT